MSSYYTVFDIIKLYESLFQDEYGRWLECSMQANATLCRCLDSIQLDLALLLSSPRYNYECSFDCSDPYIVHMYAANNKVANHKGIVWCERAKNLQFVKPNGRGGEAIEGALNEEILNLSEDGCVLLFSLLCLYKVNTAIKRDVFVEFLFIRYPQAFMVYLVSLNAAMLNSTNSANIQKHIEMIRQVLEWFSCSKDEREEDYRYLRDFLLAPVGERIMRVDEKNSHQKAQNLRSLLCSKCLEPLKNNSLSLDNVVKDISNIFATLKGKNIIASNEDVHMNCESIVNSIKLMADHNKRSGDSKIKEAIDKLSNSIKI